MELYGDKRSGNCYKIQLLLALTGQHAKWHDVDILHGDTQTSDFLRLNPNGKIPLLTLPGDRVLCESNAILYYLGRDSDFVPQDPWLMAKMLQWQNFEQYSHEPYVAVARFICLYQHRPAERETEYQRCLDKGDKALRVMEAHLRENSWFCKDVPTLADISLFAYTHVAHEGGLSLTDFPAVSQWLERVKSLPGFIPMQTQ